MSAIDPKGNEKFYTEDGPFEGLRLQATKVGEEKFYTYTGPEENLTPLQNFDTGKFFLLFE